MMTFLKFFTSIVGGFLLILSITGALLSANHYGASPSKFIIWMFRIALALVVIAIVLWVAT